MKKLLLPAAVTLLLFSCITGDKTDTSTDSTKMPGAKMSSNDPVKYPYAVNYSSQFEKSNDQNSQMVLGLWKDFDNNTLDNSLDKFADTVTMMMPGFEMVGVTRDSALASSKEYRSMFSKVTSRVAAVTALKSTDKNEEWVLVWGTEVHTNKKNVTDSVHLQETWRINKDGKIDYLMQYMRNTPAPIK